MEMAAVRDQLPNATCYSRRLSISLKKKFKNTSFLTPELRSSMGRMIFLQLSFQLLVNYSSIVVLQIVNAESSKSHICFGFTGHLHVYR